METVSVLGKSDSAIGVAKNPAGRPYFLRDSKFGLMFLGGSFLVMLTS